MSFLYPSKSHLLVYVVIQMRAEQLGARLVIVNLLKIVATEVTPSRACKLCIAVD